MSTHFFGVTNRTFSYSHSLGRAEFSGNGIRNAVDLALSDDELVYALNRSYGNRPDGIHVTVFTMDEDYVTEFGSHGEGDGQFVWPTALAIDSKGNVYVADEWAQSDLRLQPGRRLPQQVGNRRVRGWRT